MVKLTVKPIKGDEFQIDAEWTQTVQDVKAAIEQENAEFSAARLALTCSGQVLNGRSTLAECGVKEEDVLVCTEAKGLSEGPARNLTSLAVAVLVGLFAALVVFAREGTGAWLSSVPFLSSAPSSSSSSSADGGGATTPVGLAPGTGGGGGNKKGPTEAASKPTKKEKAATAPVRPTEAASKPPKKEKAAATAGAGAGAGAAKKTPLSKEIKDPATGIVFQRTKSFPPSKTDLTCLGVGVRAKSLGFTKVNVYSVGLYVEPKGARSALKKYAGADPASLVKDKSLYKALGQPGGFAKYLHLIFARGVGAQKVVDAFSSVHGVDRDVLDSFSAMVLDGIGGSIVKGESITLGWEGKDKMVVLVRDKPIGNVVDAALPKAVFDLYLGSHPVAPPAKDAFAEGVPPFLAS